MKPIKKLVFFVNSEKTGADELCTKLTEQATSIGTESIICKNHSCLEQHIKGQDVCCVIGGDGTILSTVTACIKNNVPVFGINRGKLGFLATYSSETVLTHFISILKGEYQFKERFVLECTTITGKKAFALNDVVIKHYSPYRLMQIDVYCNNQFVTSYSSDGLIISTPTGSTAYNLSAGGPIIYPGSSVFAMTPICPHTLSNRSVIFSNDNVLKIVISKSETNNPEHHAQASLDGQVPWAASNLFPIEVTIAKETLTLLQPIDYSHFSILRKKLKWGD